MNLWLDALIWAGGVLVVAFGFMANYATIVESWNRLGADKKAQPMLAVSVISISRQQNRVNDIWYVPFDVPPGEALDFEQVKEVSFDYGFVWSFVIHITNQTDHTAYKLKVIDVDDKMISMVIDPKVDYTKPITANNHKEHTFIYRMNYRCKAVKAEEIRQGYPMNKIRIEYSNLANVRFATEFFFTEADDAKKNIYLKVG